MKKVVLTLAFVAMLSVSFVSCKKTETETEVETVDTVVTPEAEPMTPASTDTVVVDSTTTVETTTTPVE